MMEKILPHLPNFNLILGSASPRRKELLERLGMDFRIWKPEVEETYPNQLKEQQIPEYLARKKAESYGAIAINEILITSDTIVWQNDQPIEKAANLVEAKEMLRTISGNTHWVYSSVCLSGANKTLCFSDACKVWVAQADEAEIDFYVSNHNVLDKAGAYGIQDWWGLVKVERIEGSFYTVMGFPVQKFYQEFKGFLNNL